MADGEIKINTSLDTSGLDKGIKDLNTKLDSAGKSLDNGTKKSKTLAESLGGIKAGAVAAVAGATAVAAGIKKTVQALNECEQAYQVQRKAEIALQTAAQNNPYLNGESVHNLKAYASELQSMSEIGDEVSLQVMSQLAATGRSEEQIKAIMSAAVDMAAVTGDSLESAATKLNATLNGNAGALGRQVSSINALTTAELESGRAIELVAQQYKGSAANMADKTVQLKNAWGDFKETIGKTWNEVTAPMKNYFAELIQGWADARKAKQDYDDAIEKADKGTANADELQNVVEYNLKLIDEWDKAAEELAKKYNTTTEAVKDNFFAYAKYDEQYADLLQYSREEIADLRQSTKLLENKLNIKKQEEQSAKETADAAEREAKAAADAAAARKKRDTDAAEHIKNNEKSLKEQIAAMELQAKLTGEEIDVQAVYNAYLQSYIDLVTKSNGLVTEANGAATKRLALLEQWKEKAEAAANEEERLAAAEELQNILQSISKEDGYFNEYEKKNTELDEYKNKVEQWANDEVITEQQKLDAMLKLDEAYAQNKRELWQSLTSEIKSYTEQTVQIAQDAASLMLESVNNQKELELAALEEKYEKGEIAEQEYYDRQKQIKKKAAQDEYKIQMFQWTASILSATANIAEGVSKAFAQGGTAGLITGALVGAAGAVQIASIIASKPIPPSFATGGVIGGMNGASMGGDNTYIHARRGEMILNASQQRSLWDKLNGQYARENGLNLTVNNTQAGRVDTDIRQQPNGEIMINIIDKHINKGFADGTYDAGFAAMNTRNEGVRIL